MQLELWLGLPSLVALLGYHVFLVYQLKAEPLRTVYCVTAQMRCRWIETIMESNQGILAIQTLRNWTMSASFLASTAILLAIGALNFFAMENLDHFLKTMVLFETSEIPPSLWKLKLAALVIDMFFAFFNFALAIRYYNHVAFMMSIPVDGKLITVDSVTRRLQRGARHYTLGMRAFYFFIPFVLWVLSPVYLLVGTVVLIPVLYKLDHSF